MRALALALVAGCSGTSLPAPDGGGDGAAGSLVDGGVSFDPSGHYDLTLIYEAGGCDFQEDGVFRFGVVGGTVTPDVNPEVTDASGVFGFETAELSFLLEAGDGMGGVYEKEHTFDLSINDLAVSGTGAYAQYLNHVVNCRQDYSVVGSRTRL